MEWTNIWVVGQAQAMTAFLNAKKVDDGQGGQVLPHGIFVTAPVYPQVADGVDEWGNPKYKKKSGAQPALWCFSLYGDKATLVDELKLLNNPNYTILENLNIDDVISLYPDYALGQGIPHIAEIKGQN